MSRKEKMNSPPSARFTDRVHQGFLARSLRRPTGLIGLLIGMTLAGCGASTPAPDTPAEDESSEKPSKDPRYASLPTPQEAPDWTPPPAKKTELENGLSVWTMGGSEAPLVSIHLMLPTGGSSDPKGKAGLTLLAADLLDEGAGTRSALELSDRLGELATDYHSSAGVDYVLLSMDALAENLQESLQILADIVRRPKLSAEEFKRRKDHHLAAALTARDDPGEARSKAINRALFGDGYAGDDPSGTSDTLEAITLSDVRKQVKRLTVPEGAHLTIAGYVDQAKALAAVKKSFGDWKGKLAPSQAEPEKAPPGKKAYVIDFPEAAQSALAVVTRASSDADANYFPEEVMNEKLGSSFTSRINMNLREDKGFTYGAFSLFRRYDKAGYFAIISNVKSETTSASVSEIFGELSGVCKERPLTEVERDEAVEGLLLGFPMEFDEVSSVGMRLVALPVHDRPVDFWKNWAKNLSAVTTKEANEAAQPYCDPEQYSVVIAGDAAQVSPELEKLGLEVALMDRDGRLAHE